ncbi:guanine deaminase [Maritimibacter dapengensis]|uniref:Guanine deaminase n=1 Tax=Maritimibacter dapengensis TaxID=2836868 RepID=A0ABS6T220_9RHOB|nr:guanine deaminase [Maritimibacter dapengensis]MBV7378631.1 guanine deaminase [Maritimibacter dapengensis]
MKLLLGQTLSFVADPFVEEPTASARWERRGAVAVDEATGRIVEVGPAEDLRASYREAKVVDHGEALILPGFIDAHVHYPQTGIIASWGKRLIDWLNSYTFPEEARFGDRAYADEIAGRFFDLALSHGTTTSVSYCTIHPESVDAYFTVAQKRGLRALGGKTCMDRNAPDDLRDSAQSAYDDSKALLEAWHGVDRLGYVVTPRFAPTSTPEQLEALGALWGEHPECLMQTHLSEQTEEIDWVMGLFPEAKDYTDIYDRFGLLGEGALMGHAIHLSARERARLKEVGASLIHCPTSNTFIGSGLFDMPGLKAEGQRIGLATDTGGGSSFSMLRTMAAAYDVGQLHGTALHPAQLLWLATCGSAEALRLGDRIGTLSAGYEADLVVLDMASTPGIAQRAARAEDIWEQVFPTIMMGDDRAVAATYVAGRKV